MQNDIKYNKVEKKIIDNNELKVWINKMFKITNIIIVPIFVICTISLLTTYSIFNFNLLPISKLVSSILPVITSSFIYTCISGGVLVFTNSLLLITKLGLNLKGESLNKTLSKLNNDLNPKIDLEKQEVVTIAKRQEKQNDFSYKYKFSENNSITDVKEKNNTIDKIKKRVRVKK